MVGLLMSLREDRDGVVQDDRGGIQSLEALARKPIMAFFFKKLPEKWSKFSV